MAAGAGLLVLLLLAFGLKSCLDASKERSFKDYVRSVGALAGESDGQGDNLFRILSDPAAAGSDVEVENQLNTFRNESDQLVERAQELDPPDELAEAHRFFVQTLEFRRDGVAVVADELPNVLAAQGDRREGTETIANSMLNFSTSDVIYQTRVEPALKEGLDQEGLEGEERVLPSTFLESIEYLQPDFVADQIGGGGKPDADAAPGLHGNGLAGVSLGGQALTPGASASVPISGDLLFEVQVANQGENTETDVQVNVTVGEGGEAIRLEKVLDEIAAGETKAVEVPLADQPPTGQNVPITVEIEPVPGEENTDNNSEEFVAIFTS